MSSDDHVDLAAAFPVDPADLAQLRARLADSAESAGLLDVAYRTLDTPVGTLLLAATPDGLVRVAYSVDEALQEVATDVSPRMLEAPGRLDAVSRELDEYFAGRRRHFDLTLDRRLSRGFRREVLDVLAADVDYGQTASYAALAQLAGNPKAVRAVGTACSTNPLPIVVPCHRVIRSDGSMGAYVGGVSAKRTLLALEAQAA